MTPELEAVARRAVACPRWRWMPGMLALPCSSDHSGLRGIPVRVVHVYEGGDGLVVWGGVYSERGSWEEWRWREEGRLPDLTDTPTIGGLLALVREAWGDPGFYAAQSGTKIKGTDIFGWDTFGYLHGKSCRGMLYRSEAEALVAALEAAQ